MARVRAREALFDKSLALPRFEASANRATQPARPPVLVEGFFRLREDTLDATEGTTRFRGYLWSRECRILRAMQRYELHADFPSFIVVPLSALTASRKRARSSG